MFKVNELVLFERQTYTGHRTASGRITQVLGDGKYRVRANGSGMYSSVYVLSEEELRAV